jgi:fumarylpyruvate hydrolase
MRHAFDLPERPAVPIEESSATFPVRRIFCIGRNYAAHAREMGKDPDREPPFFFAKFPDTAVPLGGSIPYPTETANYHYEAELVIAIGKEGAGVSAAGALDLVFGYAVGLDMTRRDLQLEARDKGRPWDTGKNFSYSAPIGPIRPAAMGHISSGRIRLTVNGETKQDGAISDMIWSCAETIAYISRFERLLPGDLIFTGTPAGVGPVLPGDVIEVTIAGLTPLKVTIGTSKGW